jgi:SAM-dependent methyltransferase
VYRRPDLYNAIYAWKNYAAEAEQLHQIIERYKLSEGKRLLDVACGTGKHIEHLRAWYECSGLDNSPHLLKAARELNPNSEFFENDMRHFDFGVWYDAVVCLFSAIGYVRTFEALESTLSRFALHTAPGGVVVVEPWIFTENFKEGHLGFDYVDNPDYKVARMSLGAREGQISVLHFHFMLGCPDGIEYWDDRSELGLFSKREYEEALERAGLETEFVSEGFTGRGLFVGIKPL